jgi:CheY-like chemotaxis protein
MDPLSESLRILVVEDNSDTLHYIVLYLKRLGHTVRPAACIDEALAALPEGDWDVLISDLGLPDGSGYELPTRFQTIRPVYAIAMSGFSRDEDLAKSKIAGFRHHLKKPFRLRDLEKALQDARKSEG